MTRESLDGAERQLQMKFSIPALGRQGRDQQGIGKGRAGHATSLRHQRRRRACLGMEDRLGRTEIALEATIGVPLARVVESETYTP